VGGRVDGGFEGLCMQRRWEWLRGGEEEEGRRRKGREGGREGENASERVERERKGDLWDWRTRKGKRWSERDRAAVY